MIISKFPYTKLSRKNINGSRMYQTPDGQSVASVTTILGATKNEESKNALNQWRRNVGRVKANEVTAIAAGRGTRMHKFLETYVETEKLPISGTNPYSIQASNMANEIIKKGLINVSEIYGSEISLYYPELFAGTTDLVGLYKNKLTIIDYKQSNKKKNEERVIDYKNQLVAYAICHNYLYNTNIQQGIIMMCTPELEYQQFEVLPDDFNSWENEWWDRVSTYYHCVSN